MIKDFRVAFLFCLKYWQKISGNLFLQRKRLSKYWWVKFWLWYFLNVEFACRLWTEILQFAHSFEFSVTFCSFFFKFLVFLLLFFLFFTPKNFEFCVFKTYRPHIDKELCIWIFLRNLNFWYLLDWSVLKDWLW